MQDHSDQRMHSESETKLCYFAIYVCNFKSPLFSLRHSPFRYRIAITTTTQATRSIQITELAIPTSTQATYTRGTHIMERAIPTSTQATRGTHTTELAITTSTQATRGTQITGRLTPTLR